MEIKDKSTAPSSLWTEIAIQTTWDVAELLAEELNAQHCEGIVLGELPEGKEDQPGPKTRETTVKGYLNSYYPLQPAIDALQDRLKSFSQFGLDAGEGKISTTVVDEKNWAHAWKVYFHPVEVTPTLVIKPSWESYLSKRNQIIIEIDPGMAFGTGTHPTTQLCLKLMEEYLKPGNSLLDLGCGSGILSIAGAKLGSTVAAVDNDPLAVDITRENARLNNVTDKISVQTGELKEIHSLFDVIVANILAEVIADLAPLIPDRLKKEGIFIGSGIIESKKDLVLSALTQNGLKILKTLSQEGWVAVVATR